MESKSYFYENERLVFLTIEDAREYYFEAELYHFFSSYIGLNEFLNDKGYTCEDVFYLEEFEKNGILSDYHEALFQSWIREELLECDVYE